MSNFNLENFVVADEKSNFLSKKLESITKNARFIEICDNVSKNVNMNRVGSLHYIQKNINKFNKYSYDIYNVNEGETILFNDQNDVMLNSNILSSTPGSNTNEGKAINNILTEFNRNTRDKTISFAKSEQIENVEKKRLSRACRIQMEKKLIEYARKKRIKSKNYHKRLNIGKKKEFQKLYERLKIIDPEKADEIKKEFEIKRAEFRIMLKSKARKNWTKLARKYGGKTMESIINEQNKHEKFEKEYINSMVNSDDYSDNDDSDNSNNDLDTANINKKESINMIIDKLKQKRNIAEENVFNEHEIEQVNHTEIMQKFFENKDKANINNCEVVNEKNKICNSNNEAVSCTDDLEVILGITDKYKKTENIISKGICKTTESSLKEIFQQSSYNANYFTIDNHILEENCKTLEQNNATYLNSDEETIEYNLNNQNEFEANNIKEMNAKFHDQIDKTLPKYLEGWGNWTGIGVEDKRKKNIEAKRKKIVSENEKAIKNKINQQSRVKINSLACTPANKYIVQKLPESYKNINKYNKLISIPIGNEFIPENTHRKLVAPKYKVLSGKIINPLRINK